MKCCERKDVFQSGGLKVFCFCVYGKDPKYQRKVPCDEAEEYNALLVLIRERRNLEIQGGVEWEGID